MLCGALALTTACSTDDTDDLDTGPPPSAAVPTGLDPGALVALPGTLAADFQSAQPALGGHAGMAIMPVGSDRMTTLGDWTTGPAWSTMKVPLTLAAQRAGDTGTSRMSTAITESDNEAADALWQSLGTPDQAARSVESILREGGDAATTVPTTRARAGYSAFGQAGWSLTDQVQFTSRLPCLPGADTVLGLMGKVVWQQRWGIGRLDNAQYKGGWGPDPSGHYLVRQLGVLTTPTGRLAISLAAQPDSGKFDEGTRILDRLAELIDKHLGELPAGQCPAAG